MNIEDCKVGMTVKSVADRIAGRSLGIPNFCLIENGDILTISKIYPMDKKISFEELHFRWSVNFFEPVNEFKVGDEVDFIDYDGARYKAKIWGISDKEDFVDGKQYGVGFEDEQGYTRVLAVGEDRLSPLKNKDELEAGDKFKSGCDKYVILFKEYDVARSEIKYLLKDLNTGELLLRGTGNIDEIIYE